MEAHAGTITIGTGRAVRPRRRLLTELRAALREWRLERAEWRYRQQVNGATAHSLPGSEHTHLIRRPRGV